MMIRRPRRTSGQAGRDGWLPGSASASTQLGPSSMSWRRHRCPRSNAPTWAPSSCSSRALVRRGCCGVVLHILGSKGASWGALGHLRGHWSISGTIRASQEASQGSLGHLRGHWAISGTIGASQEALWGALEHLGDYQGISGGILGALGHPRGCQVFSGSTLEGMGVSQEVFQGASGYPGGHWDISGGILGGIGAL